MVRLIKRFQKYISFLWAVILFNIRKKIKLPLFYNGVHLITGLPGCGKTLLASLIIDELATAEKPALVNINEFDAEKTMVFDTNDCFANGKQVKRFLPTRAMIFDEVNLHFNRRMNGAGWYNNVFIGLIELITTHRHQEIERIYFIGQSQKLQDVQLQSLVKYVHNVSSVKSPSFYFYCKNGNVIYIPKKLKVETYYKLDDVMLKIDTIKINITPEMLENYDTFGFAKKYNDLPYFNTKK